MGGLQIASSIIKACRENKKHCFHNVERRANGLLSFWALGVFFLAYVTIFHVLKVSPVAALSSTRFWFFISNTLIFIIAADSGALSSSSSTTQEKNNTQSVEPHKQMLISAQKTKTFDYPTTENAHLQIVIHEPTTSVVQDMGAESEEKQCEERGDQKLQNFEEHEKESEENPIMCEKDEELEESDDDDELSRLSDEELNRRVEDFIQNFNHQIRLQGAAQKLRHSYYYY